MSNPNINTIENMMSAVLNPDSLCVVGLFSQDPALDGSWATLPGTSELSSLTGHLGSAADVSFTYGNADLNSGWGRRRNGSAFNVTPAATVSATHAAVKTSVGGFFAIALASPIACSEGVAVEIAANQLNINLVNESQL